MAADSFRPKTELLVNAVPVTLGGNHAIEPEPFNVTATGRCCDIELTGAGRVVASDQPFGGPGGNRPFGMTATFRTPDSPKKEAPTTV
ncbi:hypothetical protein FB007_12429 [Sinorhizobium medicae]|nr:hypothetical protein FB007_12429 [Sinorhizobium medicae]